MAEPAGDAPQWVSFLSQFHNLPGDVALNKQQNLYKLMRHTSIGKNPLELDELIQNLHPKTHLETILFIDLLIYFKRYDELYEKFRSGDEITVAKLHNQNWFLQKAFAQLPPEKLVLEVFPTLPYPVRLKILNKLHLDKVKADVMFDLLTNKYNLYVATFILHQCSTDKIRHIIEHYSITFTVKQIEAVYVKDSQLGLDYLVQKQEKNKEFLQYNKILQFVARNNPKHFLYLIDKYALSINLGRRATKNVIRTERKEIESNPDDYLKVFKQNTLVRKLGKDFEAFYTTICQTSSSREPWNLLQNYNRKRKFQLFKTVFDATHTEKLGTDPKCITDDLLTIIVDPAERERYAKIKYEYKPLDNLHKFFQSESVFNELRDKVNVMSSELRAEYVRYATTSCVLNRDLETFVKLGEFIAVRLKNDSVGIRNEFIRACVCDDKKQFIRQIIGEKEWKVIMDVISIMYTRGEFNCWYVKSIQCRHLEFLLKHNRDIREALLNIHNFVDYWDDDFLKDYPDFKKKILETCIDIGYPQKSDDEDVTASYDCQLFAICVKFNKKYPRKKINVWTERLLKSARFAMGNFGRGIYSDWNISIAINYMVKHKNDQKLLKELQSVYFDQSEIIGRTDTYLWFLRHDPEVICGRLANLEDRFQPNVLRILARDIRKLSHHKLYRKFVEITMEQLSKEDLLIDDKVKWVPVLAILAPVERFLKFEKTYEIPSGKIDTTDKGMQEKNKLLLALLQSLKYIEPYDLALGLILKYCIGDCLVSVLGSLYKKICNLPEPVAKVYIEKLGKSKNVSFKKHSVHLTAIVCDNRTTVDCLKRVEVSNLTSLLRYFTKQPDEVVWLLMKSKLDEINADNSVIIRSLLTLPVQPKYACKLYEILWELLIKFKLLSTRPLFIENLTKQLVPKFEEEFCRNVINGCIFQVALDTFIFNVLFYGNPDFKFDVLTLVLKQYKSHGWEVRDLLYRRRRNGFSALVTNIFCTYMNLRKFKDVETVTKFLECFTQIFTSTDAFEEFVLINLMKCKLESPQKCAEIVVDLNNYFNNKYNAFAVNCFGGFVKDHLNLIFKSTLDQYEFCYEIVRNSKGPHDDLLVLKVLPNKETDDLKYLKFYSSIMERLTEEDVDETVKLVLNSYLRTIA